MRKIYQKKSESLEDETVLVHLERRHTLKEDANEEDLDSLRKTARTNSLGSFEEGHSSTDVEAFTAEKLNRFKRKPTVITESELSSSVLYKDQKAKINSDDEGIEDPRPKKNKIQPLEDHEDLEPTTLNDPKLKPAPISNQRPRKISSCCWYTTIILVICIACLAVMAGVGGIIYMEYFAVYKDEDITNTDLSIENDNLSAPKEIFPFPKHIDDFHRNEPKIPESVLKNILKNSKIRVENPGVSRKVTVAPSQLNDDIFPKEDLIESNESEAEELNKIKRSFVTVSQDIEIAENPKTAKDSDVFRDINGKINNFFVPIADKSVERNLNAENQDLLDLKLDYQSIDEIMAKIPDGHNDMVNEQMTRNGNIKAEKSNSKAEVLNSSEETLKSGRSFDLDGITTPQGIEVKGERVNADITFNNLPELHLLPDSDSLDNMKNDNHEDDYFDHQKHASDHGSKDNLFDLGKHTIDNNPEDNSFDHDEHSIDPDDKSSNDHNEDSSSIDPDDSSSEEHSLVNDQNQNSDDSSQLVFLRPAVESKAVPIPLAFLRRIGFDVKNPDSHQPMTANDMDIKFSLPDALQYLRSLDTESKLPISGDKAFTRETNDIKNPINHQLMTANDMEINFSLPEALKYLRSLDTESKLPLPGDQIFSRETNDVQNPNSHQPLTAHDLDIKFSLPEALKYLRSLDTESKLLLPGDKTVTLETNDVKNPNSHQPMTATDMDIKFSLAEALKHLRSLDTESKLPVSREKTTSRKTSNQESKKIKLPIKSEREQYLNLLRKQIFEENL